MNELLTMLESKYKRLEYIQSTGTQYIDTGYGKDLTHTYRFKGKINWQDVTTRQLIGAQGFTYFGVINGYYQVTQGLDGHISLQAPLNEDINFDVTLNLPENKAYYNINGTSGNANPGGIFSDIGNFFLFNLSNLLFPCKCKLYNFQLFDNDVLVRNFIPVLRKSDNEIGMLDLVEGKFYGNAGTGKFTANLDTMYALIQGTPTVQDGRVSNFSASNYLQSINTVLQNATDWEICFKYNTGNFTRFGYLVSGENNNNTRCFIFGCSEVYKKIYFYINYVSSSWKVQLNTDNSGITIQANTDYWIKVIFKNGVYSLYISTNGINYIFCQSVNGNPITACTGIIFGRANFQTTPPAEGTIDLNRSYIKIDDTKYKLQAVVGYTKVGSPTIVDGVVSGFSSSNYLQINNGFSLDSDFEIETEFSANSVTNGNLITFVGNNGNNYGMYIDTNQKIHFFTPIKTSTSTSIAGTTTIPFNTICRAKYVRNKNIQILYLDIGNDYKVEAIRNVTGLNAQNIVRFDICKSATGINQINLNNTYIKLNHKLWFNGLEA